ncbi:MAG: flagellar biosynthetic protein FliQ [Polyangiaceae bacterium]|nr:flagellar biosynthetic protein FliQ [Polyangiaceae bacterium]
MTTDAAVDLFRNAMLLGAKISGPLLLVALVVGLLIGILQAATQVNESSIAFVVKLLALGVALAVLGSWIVTELVNYTSHSLQSIATVVR